MLKIINFLVRFCVFVGTPRTTIETFLGEAAARSVSSRQGSIPSRPIFIVLQRGDTTDDHHAGSTGEGDGAKRHALCRRRHPQSHYNLAPVHGPNDLSKVCMDVLALLHGVPFCEAARVGIFWGFNR